MSSGMITARKSSRKGSKTACSTPPLSSAISEHSSVKGTPSDIEAWLMSLPPASPASPSPLPGSKRVRRTTAICGPQQHKLLKLSDLSEFCSKMCREYADTCPWSSEICEELGMRFDDPSSLGLVTAGRRTGEKGCGLWPTPRNRLTGAIKPERVEDKFNNLESVVARETYPSPCRSDTLGGPAYKKPPGRQGGFLLKEGCRGGQLNPGWVEWLMGWPIGWTDLKPLAMDRFRQWLRGFGIF